jgi:hypothetical protein
VRHRLLAASSLLLLIAVTSLALPAAGKPPPAATGTAQATFTDNGGCSFTVTYTWSGFRGRDLRASYGVVRQVSSGSYLWRFVDVYPATGSGAASHTFALVGTGAHTYSGRGRLTDTKGSVVQGSEVGSGTSATLTC